MCIDKKNFLMCGSCFWCVSCLTGNRTIVPFLEIDESVPSKSRLNINEIVSGIVDKLR